jgi:TonB family protein
MARRRNAIPLILRHTVNGKFIGCFIWKNGRQIVVGSHRDCDVRINSNTVSGVVCTFDLQESGWVISDLGSQPDLKIGGKPFVEHKLLSKATLVIGTHTLELEPVTKRREMFTRRREVSGPTQKMTVVKWRGRVIETSFGESQLTSENQSVFEILKVDVPVMEKVEREEFQLEAEMKKPLIGTFLTVALFFAAFLGIPSAPEVIKPKDNVFTKMIFDSKILGEKKKQLTSFAHKSAGTGAGSGGQVSEGAKGQQTSSSRAVASMRKAGLQSLITRIAGKASQSARLIASIAAMPTANANNANGNIGDLNVVPTLGAAGAKTALGGNNKGFKINGIGTSGKGGGSGSYKDGSGLGTGNVGNGEVALEDAESVIDGGLDREVIAAVIKEHLGQVRYCYERQLAANSDLYGKIKVKFSIDASGAVDSQSVGQSTLKSAMVEECILRRIATWKFPKPRGGTKVTVSYPFLFKSVN